MSNFSSNIYTTTLHHSYYLNNNNKSDDDSHTTLQKKFTLPSFKNLLNTIDLDTPINTNAYTYISPPNSNEIKHNIGTVSPLPITPPPPQQQQQQQFQTPSVTTTNTDNIIYYPTPQYIHNPPMQILHPHQLNPHFLPHQQPETQINYIINNNNLAASLPRTLPPFIPSINANVNQQQRNVILPQTLQLTTLKNPSIVATTTAKNTVLPAAITCKKNKMKKKNKKKRRQRVLKRNPKKSNINDLLNPISNIISSSNDKKCFQCQETNTPEWRVGPYGSRTLCNACGLYYRRLIQRYGLKQANLIMRFNRFIKPSKIRQVPNNIEIPKEIIKQFDMDPTLDNNYNTIS